MVEVDHPFLIGIDYMFMNELRIYFVMPYIQGGELFDVILQQKKLTEDTIKFYAVQIILAIGYLHDKSIIHRDLKLENILVDKDGYLKLIDYGLAMVLKPNQQAKAITGTPEYLAPEILLKRGYGKAADWWTLGIVLFEMTSGKSPFFFQNTKRVFDKIINEDPKLPDRQKHDIEYSDA